MKALTLGFLISLTLTFLGCAPGALDFDAKLAGDYSIWRVSKSEVYISPGSWGNDTPIVPTQVLECDTDGKHFIIATQQELQKRKPEDPKPSVPIPGAIHYWILDVTIPKAYGPMAETDFKKKRAELGVPEGLKLKSIYKFADY